MEIQNSDISNTGFHQRAELEVELANIRGPLTSPSALFWTWDAQSDALYLNRKGVIWHPDIDVFPRTMNSFSEKWVHPDDQSLLKDALSSILSSDDNGTQLSVLLRVRDHRGYLWYLLEGLVMERNERGEGMRMMGVVNGVDKLRSIHEARMANVERMSFALEAARDGLWDWNTVNNEMYYSPRYISMLGYKAEEFPPVLASWFDRVHVDDVDELVRRQYQHVNSPVVGDMFEFVYRFLAADGTYRWMLARAKVVQRDASGRGRRVVGLHTDITELRAAQDSLKDIVNYDHLTKLNSRFAFDARLASLDASHFPVSVIYIDVDALKLVNDSLGHEAGDRLLVKAAEIIRSVFRVGDMVARIGGDEFIALLPRCPANVAERLMAKITEYCTSHNAMFGRMPVFLSLGMASTEEGIELLRLQSVADGRMMEHKKSRAGELYKVLKHWIEEYSDRRITDSRRQHGD